MRILSSIYVFLCLLVAHSFSLSIEPDSIYREVKTLLAYNNASDTVTVRNQSDTTERVDSITIRFLDGDSSDFKMGIDCQPGQLNDYYYRGWMYGMTNNSLRYVSDSLFLLQDSSGTPLTFQVAPGGSAEFTVNLIVNCPVCGRMPSFPATEHYVYVFHNSSGAPDSLSVTIRDSVSTSVSLIPPGKADHRSSNNDWYDIAGRKVNVHKIKYSGIILEVKSGKVNPVPWKNQAASLYEW